MIECFLKIQSSTSSISIYKHLYNLCFTASAIECFECNSRDPDPNIADKCKNSPASLMSMPQYYKNCSDASARCRKIQQEGEFGGCMVYLSKGWWVYELGGGGGYLFCYFLILPTVYLLRIRIFHINIWHFLKTDIYYWFYYVSYNSCKLAFLFFIISQNN